MKNNIISHTSLLSIGILLSVLFLTCSQNSLTGGETVNEMISLYKPDGTPAAYAIVEFFVVGDTSKQYIHQTQADINGNFSVVGVTSSSGTFNIWAQLGDSLVAIQDSVYISSTKHFARDDTLGEPGSITGIVGLQPNHDPRTVTVQAVGTHLYSNVSVDGGFALSGMAAGEYTLRLSTTLPEYTDTFAHVVAVSDVADTLNDTLWLIYTGIPVVTGIYSSYDTLNGVVNLFWNKTTYKNFQDYLIYRDHVDSINLSVLSFGSTVDTFFRDTIVFTDTIASPYKYRIKIRNNSQIIGNSYKFEKVEAVHPVNVMTTITSSVINQSTGLNNDTIATSDSVLIIINFQNPTRPFRKITWAYNHPDSIVSIKTLDSISKVEKDTLSYSSENEGDYSFFVKIEDVGGTIWNCSLSVYVWDYPAVELSVDSIFGYTAFLRWTKSMDKDFIEYNIYHYKYPQNQNTLILDTIISNKNDTTYSITSLMPDSIYGFYIITKDSTGLTSLSNEVIDTTLKLWTTKTPMPTPRSYLTSSVVNGKIYVIGGENNNGTLNIVEEYDPATDSWKTKTPMLTARHGITSSVVNGKIYVTGGVNNNEFVNIVEEYDPATDSWTTKTPMPTPRSYLTSSVVNGKIYVIGGWSPNREVFNIVEEYDPVTDSWNTKSPMPTRRSSLASSEINGKIYVIGGNSDNLVYINSLEEYDPATDSWTTKTPMPTARGDLTSSVVNGRIYVIGGRTHNGVDFNNIEEYTYSK